MGLLLWPDEPAILFFWKQDRLRRRGKSASRNGFVSGVLRVGPSFGGRLQDQRNGRCRAKARRYEILASQNFFGRQAPV